MKDESKELKQILITGVAGFIGYHLARLLLNENFHVIGIDNLNSYYDISLKNNRLKILHKSPNFQFYKLDLVKKNDIASIFVKYNFSQVVHLSAQVGINFSIKDPQSYIDANITGFLNVLENCKNYDVKNLIYASSSSVYGNNAKLPFLEDHKTDTPLSVYGVSKKVNELLAHSYSALYQLQTIGLRFFTVYGPWGRPDMAYYIFTKSIMENKMINLFNNGHYRRSFTYVDDVVRPIYRLINTVDDLSLNSYEIFNIGGNESIQIDRLVRIIENILNKKAKITLKSKELGSIDDTDADISKLENIIGYRPEVGIEEGMKLFIDWYMKYYK